MERHRATSVGAEPRTDLHLGARVRQELVPRAPRPTRAELIGALRAFARLAPMRALPNDLDARDPAFIADVLPLMNLLYDDYFRCETEFTCDLPDGPALIVGNHNGMTGTPDMFCHMTAFWRRYGPTRLAYGLMHDVPFLVPAAGAWFNAAGAIAANPENARRALRQGANVLVFPGGDIDACKPFSQRYRIDFGMRRGFVRMALEQQVPIVPVVSVGAHESLFILSDGRRLAKALGLDRRFRSNVAPIGLALPYGLLVGVALPHLPLPVKIHTRVLLPIDPKLPSSAAADPEVVEGVYQQVLGAMKRAMNEMRYAGRHGLFPRAAAAPRAAPSAPHCQEREASR